MVDKVKMDSSRKKFSVPEGLNPFEIFYDQGSLGLIKELSDLGTDQIKGVLRTYTHTIRKDYVKLEDKGQLVTMAVKGIKDIACRGQEFGDYKLLN